MPFRDSEKKRAYHREYMRERRRDSHGESLNPAQEPAKFNPNRPHRHCCIKIDGTWRRVAEQEGRIYDRETGEYIYD